jgi:hypothetical protein
MKVAVPFILFGALCLGQTTRALEQRVIAAAKQADVQKLDPQLPRMRFDAWLQKQIGGAQIAWESNDCGEQDGFTARADFPLCGEASATLADGRKLTVQITVGTFRKGVQGAPALWFLALQDKTATRLSDLPKLLDTLKRDPK